MRMTRIGEAKVGRKLIDCQLYVRDDLTVVKASEWYYTLVGENSYLPVSSLLNPQDGEVLLEAVKNLEAPVELITTIMDCAGGVRNIYLRIERSEQTEDGVPLHKITLFDVVDMEKRNRQIEELLSKYRHILSLNSELYNEYYYEYYVDVDRFSIYKYINERAMLMYEGTLDGFVEKMEQENHPTPEQQEQMRNFCTYLKAGTTSFEMEFTMVYPDGTSTCKVKGGKLYKYKNALVGIMIPNQLTETEAYYLTPAARDAGTGLFNKKAATEYTVEKLQARDGKTRWFMLFDIDDFKNVNDTFGHLFGDEVIRKVAEILQLNVGYRGIVGRFGGDEFYVLLEKVSDRASLKTLVKTITKELAYAFDPQLKVTASIGIAQYPVDGEDYDELFGKADKALYVAKEKGKNRHIIYDAKLHGDYQKDEVKNMVVSYAVSREKRREALVEILGTIYGKGIDFLVQDAATQKLMRDMYDLDGITIYTNYGKTVLCRNGNYAAEATPGEFFLTDEKFLALFGKEDILISSDKLKIKALHPEAYQEFAKQEIGASIQCIARKDGVPYAYICFDVFNRNRKWSDVDVEMLSTIGSCIGKLICAGK